MQSAVIFTVAAVALSIARAASAQSASTHEPLFPAGHHDASRSLDLNGSLVSALESSTFSGVAPELNTAVTYREQRSRLTFDGSAAMFVRRDPNYFMSSAANFAMTRRTTLQAQGAMTIAPYFTLTPFAGEPGQAPSELGPQDSRFAVLPGRIRSTGMGAGMTTRLTERVTATASASIRRTASSDGATAFGEDSASSQLGRRLGRHGHIHLGYTYRSGSYETATTPRLMRDHDLETGMGWAWRHSASRQTSVGGAVGPTRVDVEGRRRYLATGSLYFSHQINKTWSATAAYRRGMESTSAFGHAPFSSAVNVSVKGHLTERFRLDVAGTRSIGQVGFDAADNAYDTYSATARLAFSVRPGLALYGEYFHYGFTFGNDVALPDRYARHIDRQGPRIGLTFEMPLARRGTL